jgi:hypothetical protein
MSLWDRDYYLRLRRVHEPENIRLVIVAESPPASGKYFYDTTGSTKEIGLHELKQRGWVLVDATYQPVDKLTKDASHDRDEVIASTTSQA